MESNTHCESGSKYLRDTSLEQEAKNAVQQAAEEMGEPLSRREYIDWHKEQGADTPSLGTVARRLGIDHKSWRKIVNIVGVEGKIHVDEHTDEGIKTALRQAVEEMGEPLTIARYESWRETQPSTIPSHVAVHRFGDGGWVSVCESVGITPGDQFGSNEQYTREELKSAVQQAAKEVGEPLSYNAYNVWVQQQEDEHPKASTIYRRLGDESWIDALQSIGVQAFGRNSGSEKSE